MKPGIKTKGFFSVMRMLQSKGGLSKPDAEYWKAMGWTGNNGRGSNGEIKNYAFCTGKRNFIEK